MSKISPKFWILLVAGMGVVAMLVLAMGISSVDLLNPTNYALATQPVDSSGTPLPAPDFSGIASVLRILIAILVPISIIYLILDPKARKRLLKSMIPVTLLMIGLYFLTRQIQKNLQGVTPPEVAAQTLTVGDQNRDINIIQPFSPSQSPSWLNYAISLGIVLLVALAVFWGWRMNQLRNRKLPVERLVVSAQDALDDIRAGGDLRDIILRCYREMNMIANEKRAVVRPDYLTPRAFTFKLEAAGLPAEHVRRLTRLFEAVRYGGWKPGPGDEREAIVCLETVVDALRSES